nr:uncharacterized protein I203_02106 [Kwoniella mangroviensis CBS 8507]OCF68720.1 hypothetical protein I203_02106 [Kwoniella mangroviensis CBS 8507]
MSIPKSTICLLYHTYNISWNKYTQVASRALRQALTETDRVAAEKRAAIGVKGEGRLEHYLKALDKFGWL